jgi:hypothetical protein
MVAFLKELTDISCDFRDNRQLLLCYEYERLIVDKNGAHLEGGMKSQ